MAEHVMESAQMLGCRTCGAALVIKADAIGRTYTRCPRCERVAPSHERHPDDAMLPQGLVHVGVRLPPIEPGQLRCQRCACGVEGLARLCPACRPAPRVRGTVCPRCDAPFHPTGRSKFCPECR